MTAVDVELASNLAVACSELGHPGQRRRVSAARRPSQHGEMKEHTANNKIRAIANSRVSLAAGRGRRRATYVRGLARQDIVFITA